MASTDTNVELHPEEYPILQTYLQVEDPVKSTVEAPWYENFVSSLLYQPPSDNQQKQIFDATTYFYNANCGTEKLDTLRRHTFYGVQSNKRVACGFYKMDFYKTAAENKSDGTVEYTVAFSRELSEAGLLVWKPGDELTLRAGFNIFAKFADLSPAYAAVSPTFTYKVPDATEELAAVLRLSMVNMACLGGLLLAFALF